MKSICYHVTDNVPNGAARRSAAVQRHGASGRALHRGLAEQQGEQRKASAPPPPSPRSRRGQGLRPQKVPSTRPGATPGRGPTPRRSPRAPAPPERTSHAPAEAGRYQEDPH